MSPLSRFSLVLPLLTLGAAPAAQAQSSGYFIPPSAQQTAPAAAPVPAAKPAPAPTPAPAPQKQARPEVPNLPALPPEPAPPTAVVGVLSVPEVMQKSTAAQGVQQIIQQRQAELGKEAQAARAKIQSEQQAIIAQRGKLSDAQLEVKEQALQNEIAATQTKFGQRNQAIQNSGQAALGQVEAELIAIIRQEAQAHGMNLVLHREQVALNVAAFDITDETVTQLNKLLPSVKVPPSVVTPGMAVNPPDQGDQGQ
ncbi:MAG: OmpH family outer membrane protein [Acidocella sp.]|nr:OmpH family outer membrane protein [Acidocella sp.]